MTASKSYAYMSSSNCGFAAGTSACAIIMDTALRAVSILVFARIPLLLT